METRITLPISVEQVAVLVRQMSWSDRERLIDLVPELRQMPPPPSRRQVEAGRNVVERMRGQVGLALGGQLLSLSEPFLGDLTLGQYLELPDDERSQLWDVWAESRPEELEELNAHPNAMPAR